MTAWLAFMLCALPRACRWPQDMVLFNDSIYYNIAYGNLAASREQVQGEHGPVGGWVGTRTHTHTPTYPRACTHCR